MAKITDTTMDALSLIMEPISKLPQHEYDATIEAIACLSIGTMHHTRGRKFTKDFVKAALASPSSAIVARQAAH